MGRGGYGDINPTTQVVIKGATGNEVNRTQLGDGVKTDDYACVFTFHFDLTEGERYYVVSVGHRGESQYTFDQLSKPGAINLSLG